MHKSRNKKKTSSKETIDNFIGIGEIAHEHNSMEAVIYSRCPEANTFVVARLGATPSFVQYKPNTMQLAENIFSNTFTEGDRVIVIYKIEYVIPISGTSQNICGFICTGISLIH